MQQALWLVSSLQQAIHTIAKMLSKTPISLTFIEPYGERSTKMADWKYALGRIFPPTTTGITKEEAIEALRDYEEVHRGKAFLFTPSGSEKCLSRNLSCGVHARYISLPEPPYPPSSPHSSRAPFISTYCETSWAQCMVGKVLGTATFSVPRVRSKQGDATLKPSTRHTKDAWPSLVFEVCIPIYHLAI